EVADRPVGKGASFAVIETGGGSRVGDVHAKGLDRVAFAAAGPIKGFDALPIRLGGDDRNAFFGEDPAEVAVIGSQVQGGGKIDAPDHRGEERLLFIEIGLA